MQTISEITSLLEANGGAVLDNISADEIETYAYVKANLLTTNVAEDAEFREKFEALYHFKKLRVLTKTKKRFFEILEEEKNSEELDMKALSFRLYGDQLKDKYNYKNYTIISIMMHTINENIPVFSKEMLEFIDFPMPTGTGMPTYRKMNGYQEFSDYLSEVYRTIIEDGGLNSLLKVLKIQYNEFKEHLSAVKRMDLIFRSGSELGRKGKLLSPALVNI